MKRALVLSGGAALGAFQAGFLYRDRKEYDLIAGVSSGALNGAMISQGKYDEMKSLWLGKAINKDNIFKSSVITSDGKIKLLPLIFKAIRNWPIFSLADSSPLRSLISRSILKKDLKMPTLVGMTSLRNSTYSPVDISKMEQEDITNALLASSSFPGIFPIVEKVNGEYGSVFTDMVDGGVGYGSSLSDVVEWIKNNDNDSEPWHIDIITTRQYENQFLDKPKNILDILKRVIRIIIEDSRKRDFKVFVERNEKPRHLNFTYRIVEPRDRLSSNFNFTPGAIMNSWNHGIELAKEYEEQWQE